MLELIKSKLKITVKNHLCITVLFLMYLILLNQGVYAGNNKKSSKILNAACLYKPNTTFVFKAVYDSCGEIQTKYIVMSVLPEIAAKEMVILYDYYKHIPEIAGDSIVNQYDKIGAEPTLLSDNKKYIQIHPPRSKYYMSQYFPFPRIKLPVKEGRKSPWAFCYINDPITTRKFLWMKYNMKILPKSQYEFKENIIDVYETKGKGVCHLGEYAASFLFNEKLGFVKWTLVANNNVSTEFTLIDTYPCLLKGYTKEAIQGFLMIF